MKILKKIHKKIEQIFQTEILQNIFYQNSFVKNLISKHFHRVYYYSQLQTWQNTFYLGIKTLKNPLDLWIYQELVFKLKPDFIIECGTNRGGTALFIAYLLDIIGKGTVITVDIENFEEKPIHNRIQYLIGSSISQEIFNEVKDLVAASHTTMVLLDSDHSMNHVLQEMNLYSRLVTIGSYLIVEDSNINGHPVCLLHGPGPFEAIKSFIKINNSFVIDQECEKFLQSFNPCGYLKKVS